MTKHRIEVIFQLGWAVEKSYFSTWENLLKPHKTSILDRGYFSLETAQASFSQEESYKILITYSLGLHFVRLHHLSAADLLVNISGFFHFHPRSPKERKYSQRILQKMINRLETDPIDTITDFYRNCYFPEPFPLHIPEHINHERLKEDLQLLHTNEWKQIDMLQGKKVLILHGKDDKIVPLEKACEQHNAIPDSKLILYEKAGHALPLTHAIDCWNTISHAINH